MSLVFVDKRRGSWK